MSEFNFAAPDDFFNRFTNAPTVRAPRGDEVVYVRKNWHLRVLLVSHKNKLYLLEKKLFDLLGGYASPYELYAMTTVEKIMDVWPVRIPTPKKSTGKVADTESAAKGDENTTLSAIEKGADRWCRFAVIGQKRREVIVLDPQPEPPKLVDGDFKQIVVAAFAGFTLNDAEQEITKEILKTKPPTRR